MAVPYDLYIRFLITRGLDELPELNDALAAINLAPVNLDTSLTQLGFIENTVPQSVIAQMGKKTDASYLAWMKVLELKDIWKLEKPYIREPEQKTFRKLLYDIHCDPELRLTINCLLIKGVPAIDVSQTVIAKYSALLKEEHIEFYSRFFFDPRRMTRADWKNYLGAADDREKRVYFLALTETLDVLKSELELPSKVDVSGTLQYLLSRVILKAKEQLHVNTPEAGAEARKWIDKAVVLTEKYEKFRAADQSDFGKNLQLEFEYIETEFDTPDSDILQEMEERNRVGEET